MRIASVFLIAAVALGSGCATAKPKWKPTSAETFSKPVGLQEAVTLAESQDLRVEEWSARNAIAKAAVRQAWTPPNPTLTLGWEDVGLKDAAGKSQTAPSVGVSYPILFWITRPWEISAARHRRQAAEQTILAEKRDLAAEVGTSWYEIAALMRKQRLAEEAVSTSEQDLRFVQRSRELGSASALDVERAEAELLKVEATLADVSSALRTSQLSFAFALGADRPAYPVVEESVDWEAAAPNEAKLPAAESSPEVVAAREEAIAAGNDLSVEFARIVPLSDTQAGVSRKNGPDGMSTAYSADVPIPLFDWNQAGIARARAGRILAEIAAERARRDATLRSATAWDQWTTARAKYLQTTIPLQEKSSHLGTAGARLFAEGQIDYSEFMQTRRDATEASTAAVDAWQNARTAEWRLLCLASLTPEEATADDAHPAR